MTLTALTPDEAVERGIRGGLVLAPSGPGLCDLASDPDYREALIRSDLNLTDSSLVVLARLIRGHRLVARTSGLRYLHRLLQHPDLYVRNSTFWVMPSLESLARNLTWLSSLNFRIGENDCYLAPAYPRRGFVEDSALLATIKRRRPEHIFVCVGGGVQEKLGLYLKSNLPYTPGIHCVGAAIAFLSGDQVAIPLWADRLALGWLFRCAHNPRLYVPRYARALKLVYLVARYDERSPSA